MAYVVSQVLNNEHLPLYLGNVLGESSRKCNIRLKSNVHRPGRKTTTECIFYSRKTLNGAEYITIQIATIEGGSLWEKKIKHIQLDEILEKIRTGIKSMAYGDVKGSASRSKAWLTANSCLSNQKINKERKETRYN